MARKNIKPSKNPTKTDTFRHTVIFSGDTEQQCAALQKHHRRSGNNLIEWLVGQEFGRLGLAAGEVQGDAA